MGQTLTHGVYLPDEGERNCYNGLAANWSILDGAVGTVAEHTTQIAGKAPLVHTHTKADITDLFNSANTWTEENTFTANNTNFKRSFTLGDNSYNICRLQYQDASLTRWGALNFIHNTDNSVNCDFGVVAKKENDTANVNASIRLTIKPDNSAEFIPLNNNKINLGSSNNQWKSVYAQSYYYNGVAWGLDKANVWSGDNSFTSSQLTLKNSNITRGTIPNANRNYILSFTDSNNDNVGMIFQQVRAGTGSYKMTFSLNNGTTDHRFNFFGFTNGTSSLIPEVSGVTELGSSDNKWKTLNGINPGALSLPNFSNADPIDTRNWVTSTPTNNAYTPSENGWLNVVVADSLSANEFSIYVKSTNFFASAVHKLGDIDDNKGKVGLFIPVIAGITYYVVVKGNVPNTAISATLYPCFGNV